MTPAEIAAQLLLKSRVDSNNMTESDKTEYYRKKKAQDFVQGYLTVVSLKKDLIANGYNPEDFTAITAVEELVKLWEHSAEHKAHTAI